MKKMVTIIVALAAMISIVSTASAEKRNLGYTVSCTSTTSYVQAEGGEVKANGSVDNSIYVRHYDNVDTEEYTNHFRGRELAASGSTTRGSKWCTQYMEVPIQNNNIKYGWAYTVDCRGNTNYYEYDGINRVRLDGTYDVSLMK